MHSKTWAAFCVSLLLVGSSGSALAAAGTIGTSFSTPGPINLGDTFTVTLSISGYPSTTEIDGYNFHVAYDSLRFSFVGGSGAINDAPGASQNWLRFAPQDGVGAGAVPLSDFTLTGAGTLDISVADLRFSSVNGTTAASGFLYSFGLTAIGLGTGAITPSAPGGGGTVLFDNFLSPDGTPGFVGGSMTVVPEPSALALLIPFFASWLALRVRRDRPVKDLGVSVTS